MIRIIGVQKAFLIALLAGLTVAIFLYGSYVLGPQIEQKDREVRSTRSTLSEITNNTNALMSGLEKFEEQREVFAQVQQSGFFNDQSRVEARNRIEALQEEAQLMAARYNIRPAKDITSDELQQSGYKILESEMDFTLEAVQDEDIYHFLYLLTQGFPGQVAVSSLVISREQELTQPLLRNIGLKAPFNPLVESTVKVRWRTMVPDTSIALSGDEQ
jgi:hypothetical protein